MTPTAISGRSSGTKLTWPCTRTAPLATRISACPAVTGASRSSSATPAGTASLEGGRLGAARGLQPTEAALDAHPREAW